MANRTKSRAKQISEWFDFIAHISRKGKRPGFDAWVGKIHWRRKWQSTPVFMPGKFHGPKSLVGLQSMGSQRVGHN